MPMHRQVAQFGLLFQRLLGIALAEGRLTGGEGSGDLDRRLHLADGE
jgi:hypothetical protein